MLPLCKEEGVGVLPWSPLARGYLTRRPDQKRATTRGRDDDFARHLYSFDAADTIIDRVVDLAEARGVGPAQVALAWLLAQPSVTAPIVGATKLKHLEDAVAAVDLTLTDDELKRLGEPYAPRPVLGHS